MANHISLVDSIFNKFRNEFLMNQKTPNYIDLGELRFMVKTEIAEYLRQNSHEPICILCYDITGVKLK